MTHLNKDVAILLGALDLGSSVAELDDLLEVARVDTSAFTDLFYDRVDLIPGTKGSGKSALFRIFVEFLPDLLLRQRKVVVAHGVQAEGDPVFQAFEEEFKRLSEREFVSFWCIYLVSLAHEQFVKGHPYRDFLKDASVEIEAFRRACQRARIPDIPDGMTLRGILGWTIEVLKSWRPKVTYAPPGEAGNFTLDVLGQKAPNRQEAEPPHHALPQYANEARLALEAVLSKTKLSLWLMVDRLDEIFPRRSEVERKALRGLLHAMRYFASASLRVKVFLRDDMLDQVVGTQDGFTALTHVTARQADTLRWTDEQILTMVVKRFFADSALAAHIEVDKEQLDASATYREECFYKLFPSTVYRGPNQSPTLRWICNRCADGRGVVTPRDVLDLLIPARQRQQDICTDDPDGTTEWIIGSPALRYGFTQLSERKRRTYLKAEFPHLWTHIEKFVGGKADYDEAALQGMFDKDWKSVVEVLAAIGVLSKRAKAGGEVVYSIPFLYRHGLQVTQGKA